MSPRSLCFSLQHSQLNISLQFPWKVLTARGRWSGDTRLRVECFDPSTARACCEVVMVRSAGEAGQRFPHRMGVYTAHSQLSGRIVYKHVQHSVPANTNKLKYISFTSRAISTITTGALTAGQTGCLETSQEHLIETSRATTWSQETNPAYRNVF